MREFTVRIHAESTGFQVEEEFKDVPNCAEEAVSWEFARILRGISDNMDMYSWEKYKEYQVLKDQHGNKVGYAHIVEKPEAPKFLIGDHVEIAGDYEFSSWMITDKGMFDPKWFILHNLDHEGEEIWRAVHQDKLEKSS